ncbi:probable LRR receptor-like serine/threonine-protein kinase At1g53430 isoform X3 [Citrus sinensis]|uniref:probable LRR receptor-like serine/threonine-protein kinase At1g53430 isoform X3 n=1 Tax=Citrus sinensis TaxID=2711 RepID=UPI002277A1FC|nr:probable LRR receptor-like serine/threonine-protein kinase At1g53430 isoform X3 [Citrus sinensis]
MGKIVSVFVVLGFLVLNCFANFGSHAQRLPDDEVQTLQSIFRKLNFRNGQVNQTSCTEGSWNVTIDDSNGSNFTCDCTYSNNTVCHVTVILLKGFNLAGVIPEEFGNLTFLQEVDLSRNYFNGSLPKSFARLQNLTKLLILGNRLSGSIPLEIGDISTLEELVLEDNQLVGPLPENLGNLKSLRRILLSSNNFTGSIPESYGNLKNLTEFRIDGSNLTGRIPNFIVNWTKLDRLDLQGTSLEGPIPSTISQLKNLTELRISDLKGSSSSFPNLQDMKKMERLILRNCLITGRIPEYIEDMTDLKILDLSFNQLSGPVPGILQNLKKIDYIFLTNNSLSGTLPDWILTSEKNLDLSYNNFTESSPATCRESRVNILSSFSSTGSNSVSWCLKKDLPCPKEAKHYSLFINCGGSPTEFEENDYEEDLNTQGPSNFGIVSDRWAYSSTGVYVGNESSKYLAANQYGLNVSGAEYYKTARLAPQSLKYYGLCMLKGSYTVKLHFAEIMFTNDQTYKSLGKRMFDVSIQGKQVLKDFDIMEEAGGVGIGITREFKDVSVNGSTMEIHLYWAGKGTNAIPYRGVYGPLISAITVTPNFEVDTGGGLSAGAIVGIIAGSCAVVIILLFILWRLGYLGGKNVEDKELRGLDLQTGYFTLRQIKAATNNFDAANKIGEGGFGPVYKGTLSDGAVIAVKQLSSKSKQGNREFVNEIGMISALQHQNLVKLYGCCIEGNQLLLVYEYLENNSLARALFGKEGQCLNLDWATRKRICSDIARGLAYLHEESRLKIVHRDIKATNVLLDKDLNAKISDFGLAKLDEDENTHISTRIAGTVGYMAPEYAMRGYLTDKADVYSFGIVALEIVSGKSNTNYRPKEEFVYLLDWAYVLQEQGNLLELVDPSLGSNFSKKEAMTMLNIALLCTNPSPTLRPTMSSAVSMLEGKTAVQAPIIRRNSDSQDARFRAFEILSQDSQTHVSTLSQESEMQRTMSIDAPWTDSSVSVQITDETREHSSSSMLLQNENNV